MYSKVLSQLLVFSNTKGLAFTLLSFCIVLLNSGTIQAQDLTEQQRKNLQEIIDEREQANVAFKKWLTPERIKELGLVVVAGSNAPIDPKTGAMLVGLDIFGKPKFYKTTSNAACAITTSANRVMPGGDLNLNLTGAGKQIHEWDGGSIRATHQELTGRVVNVNSTASLSDHATHVAGTMIASGVVANAKGMATQANIRGYDYNNDLSEITTAAQAGAKISNHSYGQQGGWEGNRWYGTPSVSETDDYKFGFYDTDARDLDRIAFNAPFYLMLWAAGNDRSDSRVTNHQVQNSSGSWVSSTLARDNDGPYDCILPAQTAKNVLTIGAINSVGANQHTTLSRITMSTFSSWGPTDDGRIKPDLVAQGVNVSSPISTGDNAYDSYQGTSMATPNATGSLALMQVYFKQLKNREVLSATLKAYAINTAYEAGTTNGPDYSYGWGLLNTAGVALAMQNDGTTSRLYENNLTQGQTYTTTFNTTGTNIPKLTMVWTDPEATVFTANGTLLNNRTPKLVNDLDVRLISPSGTRYSPWVLDPATPTAAATRADNIRDNVEQVIGISEAGVWTIEVAHKGTLRNANQNYSIVLTGATLVGCPQVPVIFANSSTSICPGGSVTLVGPTGTGISYLWSNGATTKDIAVTQAGSYTLRTIANNCTTTVSNAISVTISATQPPARPVITANGPTTINFGSNVVLSAPTGFSYLWSTGATTRTITVSTGGSYTVSTIAGNCTSEVSLPTEVIVVGGICSGQTNLSASSGTLSDGPGNYANDADCSWLITSAAGSTFTFTFTAFNTESGFDFVRIYNGTNATGTLIGSYSGPTIPNSVQFTGTSAFVQFTSDGNTTRAGFTLNYTAAIPCAAPATPTISAVGPTTVTYGNSVTLEPSVPNGAGYNYLWNTGEITRTIQARVTGSYNCRVIRNNCSSAVSNAITVVVAGAPTCSGSTQLLSANGVISDGANNYFNSANCDWSINGGVPGRFTFNFLTLDTESGYDFIRIYNGANQFSGTLIGSYSGNTLPAEISFTGTAAFVTFTSDLSQTGTGFNLQYGFRPSACDSVTAPTLNLSGDQTICSGGAISLRGPDAINYLWSNGETEQTMVITSPGTYSLRKVSGACTSAASLPVTVNYVSQLPTPFVLSTGSTTFCEGLSVTLEGPVGYRYIWSNGDTTQFIEATTAGEYSLRVFSGSCTSATSSTILVNTLPSPPQPTIAYYGWDTLDAGVAANSYIWNYNGNLISGSTRKIVVRGPGTYRVTGIGNQNCRSPLSAPFVVNTANSAKKLGLSMYPNPANKQVNISVNGSTLQSVAIYSADGKLVLTQTLEGNKAIVNLPIKSGIYIVSIQTNIGTAFERLLVK
jgi:hypothetical protein